MGFLRSLWPAPRPEQRSLENPAVPLSAAGWIAEALGGGPATSGVLVNRESAMGLSSWWRAIWLVSSSVAKLPFHVYHHVSASKKIIDRNHPAFSILNSRANALMTWFVWNRLSMIDQLTAGNHYSYVVRNNAGRPIEILPLRPELTWPVQEVLESGKRKLWYLSQINPDRGDYEMFKIAPENMIHFRNIGFTGLLGMSVIQVAREAIGLGMGTNEYRTIFFRNSARPGFALEVPVAMKEQAINNLKASWEMAHTGLKNAHRVAILRDGVKAKALDSFSAADMQLIEQSKFSLIDIANYTGCPAQKLGAEVNSSYGSLEQMSQDFMDDTLDPHWINMGAELEMKLLSEDEQRRGSHSIDVDRRKMNRANLEALTKHLIGMMQYGAYSPNDALHILGDNPRPGGDVYYPPPNMSKFGDEDGASNAPAKVGPDGKPVPQQPVVKSTQEPELIPLPPMRQLKSWDCGDAVAKSVCEYLGCPIDPDTEEAYINAIGSTPEKGTSPHQLIDFFMSRGLSVAVSSNMTLEDLAACWKRGMPVVVCYQNWGTEEEKIKEQSGHWSAVVGVPVGHVFLMDPSIDNVLAGGKPPKESESDQAPGLTIIPGNDFLNRWWRDNDGKQEYIRFGIAVARQLSADAGAAPSAGGKAPGDSIDPNANDQPPAPPLKGPEPQPVFGYGRTRPTAKRIRSVPVPVAQPPAPSPAPPQQINVNVPQPVVNIPPLQVPIMEGPTVKVAAPVVHVSQPAINIVAPHDDSRDAQLRQVHRLLVVEAVKRMVKRIAFQAQKRSGKPNDFCAWLETFHKENREVMLDAIGPPVLACCTVTRKLVTPGEVVDGLLGDMRKELDDVTGRETAATLPAAVQDLMGRWENEWPGRLADSLAAPEIRSKPGEAERTAEQAIEILDRMPDAGDKEHVNVPMPVEEKPGFDVETIRDRLKDATEDVVKIRRLIAMRDKVKRERVRDFIKDPDLKEVSDKNVEGLPTDKPYVVRWEGDDHIWDGHHRLIAYQLRGVGETVVYLVDLGGNSEG